MELELPHETGLILRCARKVALKGPLWGFFRSRAFSGDLRASGLCKSLCFLPPTSYSDRQDPDSWLCLGNQFLETDLGKRSGEM